MDGQVFKISKTSDEDEEKFKQEEYDLQNSLESIVTKLDQVDEFSLF